MMLTKSEMFVQKLEAYALINVLLNILFIYI